MVRSLIDSAIKDNWVKTLRNAEGRHLECSLYQPKSVQASLAQLRQKFNNRRFECVKNYKGNWMGKQSEERPACIFLSFFVIIIIIIIIIINLKYYRVLLKIKV